MVYYCSRHVGEPKLSSIQPPPHTHTTPLRPPDETVLFVWGGDAVHQLRLFFGLAGDLSEDSVDHEMKSGGKNGFEQNVTGTENNV